MTESMQVISERLCLTYLNIGLILLTDRMLFTHLGVNYMCGEHNHPLRSVCTHIQ